MKPSDLRMRAISTLSFDAGISTRSWRDVIPLRIRVSISAIGSVIDIRVTPVIGREELPARLRHAGDVAPERELAEADAAELELPQKPARTSALPAAVALAHRELRFPLRLDDH